MAAHTEERFGSVDILVYNAGTFIQGPFTELDHDSWHRLVDVNLTGTLNRSHLVIPGAVETGGGRVVNVSSMAGRNVSSIGAANYTVSKWAVIGLTNHMAPELAH